MFWIASALAGSLVMGTGQAPQRAIEIWSEHPIALEIEWLTIDEAGRQTVTARRKTAIGPPVPLEFTPGNDRYVRFSYQGASPRTYSTAELIAVKKLRVPDVLPGGELLLLVPRMTVRPVELMVEGPRVQNITLTTAAHNSLFGMPAGEYRVVTVYEGGIKGEARAFTVKAAQTTLAHLPAEDVGAVRVAAATEACALATEINLNALVRADVGPQFKGMLNRHHIVTSQAPRCEMVFAGLKPGRFELFYRRDKLSTGVALFDVAAQSVSAVEVAGPSVRLGGRVTVNGKPLKDATLSIVPLRNDREERMPLQAEARTDADGFYTTALERPGNYSVLLRRQRGVTMKQAAVVDGSNTLDFALTGGTITVDVAGVGDRTSVTVIIEGKGSRMMSSFNGRQDTRPVYDALPYGEYKVTVTTSIGSGRRSAGPDPQTVFLSAASPEARLKFDLTGR